MKRKLSIGLLSMLVVTFLVSAALLSNENVESMEALPSEFASEYVLTIDNEELISTALNNFPDLFDNVEKVDLHKSMSGADYYTIYGEKDLKTKVFMVKVTPEEVANQSLKASSCGQYRYCVEAPQWNLDCGEAPLGIACGCRNNLGECDVW